MIAHEPRALEGAKLEATLRPAGGEALAATLRVLSGEGLPALVRGGGTRLETANAPCRARVLLETQGLAEPPEIDAEEGVARFAAGAQLSALRVALAGSGWELPLDPPGAGATLGGALAAAASGPRFGSPRDVVLGLERRARERRAHPLRRPRREERDRLRPRQALRRLATARSA